MIVVRVLAAFAKPALAGTTLIAASTGAWLAIDRLTEGPGDTAFQQVQDAGQLLLVSEFGEHEDTILAVDPHDVSARTTIATVDHAEGYGIFAALGPAGDAIAYTALPLGEANPRPDTPALAAIVDAAGDVTQLAADVDLLITPVWAPDGEAIVVRKNTPGADDAGSFELLLLGRDGSRSTITSWSSAAVFPIAFSPDGARLYFATLSPRGTDLYSVAPDGAEETMIAHLSDEIARDWRLSPDGSRIAYSVAVGGPEPGVATRVLDLASGDTSDAATSSGSGDEFNPTWQRDGGLTIASMKPDGGGDAVALDASGAIDPLTDNEDSIDLPLEWSPDGEKLVVRNVEGASAFDAGASHVEIVGADGGRERVSESADVLIVGWLE
jgi:Tol biopolymer transport system component